MIWRDTNMILRTLFAKLITTDFVLRMKFYFIFTLIIDLNHLPHDFQLLSYYLITVDNHEKARIWFLHTHAYIIKLWLWFSYTNPYDLTIRIWFLITKHCKVRVRIWNPNTSNAIIKLSLYILITDQYCSVTNIINIIHTQTWL